MLEEKPHPNFDGIVVYAARQLKNKARPQITRYLKQCLKKQGRAQPTQENTVCIMAA